MKRTSIGYEAAIIGFSDEKLEQLCRNSLAERGLTPWATWESENTSFGKTFRAWACYPLVLPLCFSSDHAVHYGSRCWPNEINSTYKIFFTWNKKKSNAMNLWHDKLSYHVPHPWIWYRKRYWGNPPEKRTGTLIFFPHSNGQAEPIFKDFDAYIEKLKSLPEKYKPLSICISFHDIQKGAHEKLRKYGLPIVSAGFGSSRDFVDRFYSLIYQFRYATSPNIGTHTFYVLEAGIPFFLFGDDPEYLITGSESIQDGLMNLKDYGDDDDIRKFELLRSLLSQQTEIVTNEQKILVNEYLGMDSEMTRIEAAKIIWLALVSNLDKVILLYVKSFWRLLKKRMWKS